MSMLRQLSNLVAVTCLSWCDKAQEFIAKRSGGLSSCRKINLDELPPDLEHVKNLGPTLGALTGQQTIPNIFIARKHIGGFSELVQCAQRCESGIGISSENNDICDFLRTAVAETC